MASCAKKLTKAKTNIFNKFMASARGLTTIAAEDKDIVAGVLSTTFFCFVEELQRSFNLASSRNFNVAPQKRKRTRGAILAGHFGRHRQDRVGLLVLAGRKPRLTATLHVK